MKLGIHCVDRKNALPTTFDDSAIVLVECLRSVPLDKRNLKQM